MFQKSFGPMAPLALTGGHQSIQPVKKRLHAQTDGFVFAPHQTGLHGGASVLALVRIGMPVP